jgi:HPt (histidine-containing phosphotransfer) domain-containing protein
VTADPDVLEKLRVVGGPKLVRELIELFLRYAPERIALVRAGLAAGDFDAAQRPFHSLKSSAGQLGIETIREGCSRGEAYSRNRDATGAQAALADVEAAWPAALAWLKTELAR